ncbi:MAG: hypothetical protein IMZ71_00360 [Chloroflexi bacterium]|nr:hypothetical protein [Chloroflexota bacterium]
MKASEWAECDEPQSLESWKRRQKAILADLEAAEKALADREKDALSRMNGAFAICDKAREGAEADRGVLRHALSDANAHLARVDAELQSHARVIESWKKEELGWGKERSILLARLAKMQEALGFYANDDNYKAPQWGEDTLVSDIPVIGDGGNTARTALAEGDAKEEINE